MLQQKIVVAQEITSYVDPINLAKKYQNFWMLILIGRYDNKNKEIK